MCLYPTDEYEIETIITNVKSNFSAGHNGLSSDILKTVAHNLVKPLSHIINCSFNTGIVPLDMKLIKVIPVYKSDDINNDNNYWCISVLPFFSKLIEKIVYNRTMYFLPNITY